MELMIAVKQLDFKKVAAILSKSNTGKTEQEDGKPNDLQISLIRSAMDTRSIEMLEMVLQNTREMASGGNKSEKTQEDVKTTTASNEKPNTENFIQTAVNTWKKTLYGDKTKKQEQINSTIPETISEEVEKSGDQQPSSSKTTPRTTPRQSCPAGLDEKYFLFQNRRHCTWYDEENPEDVASYDKERKKQQAYMDEVSKAEELLKSMKSKRKRKHSVGKSLS